MFARILLAAGLALATSTASAQELALKRIFQSPALDGASPRMPRLSPDGELLALLRNRADDRDRYDLWTIDTRTGEERLLVDSGKVVSMAVLSEAEKMRRERLRL
ncbi:MAG TPA: S9 family peptidase, partial [Sphingomicrobium sp.]|nr:S9 family peptidase [Sphingomicrobium sp.]